MNEKQKEKNMIDNTETNNTDTLGKRIMALRKAAGMTQEQVAERLGVSPQAVSKWENDVSCPDVTMIPRIAQLFNVSTDELLGLKASTVRPADTSSYSHGNGGCCKSSSATQGIGFGLLLIVLGIAYLVSRSTNASFNIWGILWPTVLLGLGVSSAIKHRSVFFLGVAGMGFYYLLFNLGNKMPFEMSWSIVIPFALILFGIDTVLKKLFPSFWGKDDGGHWDGGKRAVRSFSCENGFVSCSTVFGENILGAEPCDITGGRIKTAFGHCVLDLSACTFAPETHFSIETSFGSLELILPRNVRVNSSVEAAFGGVETKGHPDSADAILDLRGSTAFGATQIRYN